jgi:hypothetical protein
MLSHHWLKVENKIVLWCTQAQAKYLHTLRIKQPQILREFARVGFLYIEEVEAKLGVGVEVEVVAPRSMPSRKGPPPRPF